MKTLFSACFLFINFFAFAQGGAHPGSDIKVQAGSMFFSVGGIPVNTTDYSELVEGTPYFSNDWMKAHIVMQNGAIYKDVISRLDLHKGEVRYLDQFGAEFILEAPVKEIVLTDTVNNKNFRFIHASVVSQGRPSKKNTWYQWLLNGEASLYKLFTKELFEQKRYGSASVQQRIQTSEKYAVVHNGIIYPVKKIKEVPALLPHKKADLEAFIKSGKFSSISAEEDRFVALIEHYNSLK